MEVKLLTWLKDGKYRIKILQLLNDKVYISSELAKELGINRTSVSRMLKVLKEKGLVKNISSGGRTISYVLTSKGSSSVENIKRIMK